MNRLVVERRIGSQYKQYNLSVFSIIDEPLDRGLVVDHGQHHIIRVDISVVAVHDDVVTVTNLPTTNLGPIHRRAVGLDRVEARRL